LGVAKRYFEQSDQGVEKKIRERVEIWRKRIAEAKEQAAQNVAKPKAQE